MMLRSQELRSPVFPGSGSGACFPFLVLGLLLPASPSPSQNRALFSVAQDEGRSRRYAEAKRLLDHGKYASAIGLLREVLESSSSAVTRSPDGGYLGLRYLARETLARLPGEAASIYEDLAKGTAKLLLPDALIAPEGGSFQRLRESYPGTRAAETALAAGGLRYLEQGRVVRAWHLFSSLSSLYRSPSGESGRLICRRLLSLPLPSRSLGPDMELPFAGRNRPLRSVLRALSSTSPLPLPASGVLGGGIEGSHPSPAPLEPVTTAWSRKIPTLTFFNWNILPVTDGKRVYLNTGTGIHCLDLLTGRTCWSFQGPLHEEPSSGDFLASISPHQIQVVGFGKGLVVASIQVPKIPDIAKENTEFNGIPVMRRLPVRRLFAFEADSGRLIWSHWDPEKDPPKGFEDAVMDVSGPPLVVGDTVYVPTHKQLGTIAFYVSAFDLESGSLRWKTLICSSQVEVNMFGNAYWEHAASPLACSDGFLFGTTNLGLAFSLSLEDGAIRWLRPYEIIPLPPAQMIPQAREVYWGNNPPIAHGETVVMTPLDSVNALCFDRGTGKILWEMPFLVPDSQLGRSYPMKWMLGIRESRLWFSGDGLASLALEGTRRFQRRARLVSSASRLGIRQIEDRSRMPRGILTSRGALLPTATVGILSLDVEGKIRPGSPSLRNQTGNLCSSRGILVTVQPLSQSHRILVKGLYSFKALIDRARNKVRKHPGSPEFHLELAELIASRPDTSPAIEQQALAGYRKALLLWKRRGTSSTRPNFQRAILGLFRLELRIGRRLQRIDLRAASGHLWEAYEASRKLTPDSSKLEEILDLHELLLRSSLSAERKEEILRSLRDRFPDTIHDFQGFGPIPAGLYAAWLRMKGIPETRSAARGLATLLQEILEKWGGITMRTGKVRDLVLVRLQDLIRKFGPEVYAHIERRARKLLDASKDDPAALRSILRSFPLTKTAKEALLSLASLSARNGDFAAVLDAYGSAAELLSSIPPELKAHLSRAALAAGNRLLALELSGNRDSLPEGRLFSPATLNGIPDRQVFHSARSSSRDFGHAATTLVSPLFVRGFPSRTPPPLLLLRNDRFRLMAFKNIRSSGLPDLRKYDWEIDYDPGVRALPSWVFGEVLVLSDPGRVRGLSLANGKVLWSLDLSEGGGGFEAEEEILLARPLRSGLLLVVTGSPASKETRPTTLLGLEPLTGKLLFRREIPAAAGVGVTDGRLFFLRPRGDRGARTSELHLCDGLDARSLKVLSLDGRRLPRLIPPSPDRIVLASDGVYLLTLLPGGFRKPGLYALDPEGEIRWEIHPPRLGERDGFILVGKQVQLQIGFRSMRTARVLPLDRTTGKASPPVTLGRMAFPAEERSTWGRIPPRPRGFYVWTDSEDAVHLSALGGTEARTSWDTVLPWESSDLRRDLVSEGALFGPTFLLLGKERRLGRRNELDLLVLDMETGSILERMSRSYRAYVNIAPWHGYLVIHSWLDTWILRAANAPGSSLKRKKRR